LIESATDSKSALFMIKYLAFLYRIGVVSICFYHWRSWCGSKL